MTLQRPKWSAGRVVRLEHTSKVLKGNPLGDPHVRTLDVWLPSQYDQLRGRGRGRGRRFPVVFDLVGFLGSGRGHTNWRAFDENAGDPYMVEMLDTDGASGPRKGRPCLLHEKSLRLFKNR